MYNMFSVIFKFRVYLYSWIVLDITLKHSFPRKKPVILMTFW
jgi:hypothetical protein